VEASSIFWAVAWQAMGMMVMMVLAGKASQAVTAFSEPRAFSTARAECNTLFWLPILMQQCLVQVDDDISSVQECKRGQGDAVLSRSARCRLSKVCCHPF